MTTVMDAANRAPLAYEHFDDFFRDHYGRLVGALRLAGADPDRAEDIAQEAMTRTLGRWRRVRGGSNPAGYAYVVAFRLLRKRVGIPTTPLDEQPVPSIESLVASRDAVVRAMEAMPPQRRACAVAVLQAGLSAEEAGDALGIQAGTVRAQVSRARADLRAALGA